MNAKESFMAVLKGMPVEVLPFMPITMSFAANQIGVPYKKYATEARIQADGQLKIAEKFGATQVSVISDPCVEAHDLGSVVTFPENATPYVNEVNSLLAEKSALSALIPISPEDGRRMSNRLKAIRLLAESVGEELLVEGWVEGPCAEAADLRGINRLMMDFFDDEVFVCELMDFITEIEINFALAQLKAGAGIIGIGDAASSLIGPEFYARFSAPRTRRYIEAIHNAGGLVRLHICGTTEGLAESWKNLGADMIDIDAGNSLTTIRSVLGPAGGALAGNLDPVREVRNSNPEDIRMGLSRCLTESKPAYIVGAGCEIPGDTPEKNIMAMKNFALSPSLN